MNKTSYLKSVKYAISFSILFLLNHSISISQVNTNKKTETITAISGVNLFLLGTFDDYTADTVIKILENNTAIERIVLTANGGSINDDETLKLGRYIRSRALNTHLISNGVLASGGVSLFLSGVKRSIGKSTFMGVHSWAQCSGSNDDCKLATEFGYDDPAHHLHLDYTKEMLGSGSFYWFSINSAPHNSIYWLTNEDLHFYKIINHSIDLNLTLPFEKEFKKEYELTCHNCPKN